MRRLREGLLLVALLGIGLAAGGAGTYASWAASSENTGNSIKTGTVALTDSNDGNSVFTFTGIRPGPQTKQCVLVTNAGTTTVDVQLYGAVSGDLKDHMTIKVTRGAEGGDCTTPGAGPVVYEGELNAFPTSAAPITTPPSWSAGHKYPFVFELVLRDEPGAQGKTASVAMTWKATT
ncbi:MAG: hypothetical protein AVDCRST_MAG85-4227 [uncultured Solirubrobacteraceae bacterium]|uniref:SipW-cognate class signal peptide n=1 Tax=uncultured Solirubrobacteraceae bacterium TaxID=1162706 RepID=A0A6J4U3B2_9ACTN|nr:MAG: hypothetical protein AVDCRST_MAG85-4227 [uncultured Solirubrobacteraceae bacterium]